MTLNSIISEDFWKSSKLFPAYSYCLPFGRAILLNTLNNRDAARAQVNSLLKLNSIDKDVWIKENLCTDHALITASVAAILKDAPDLPIQNFFKHQETCEFCFYVGNLLIV